MNQIDRFEQLWEELFKNKSEIRPYNKDMERDGNWHYVHRQDIADMLVKVRGLFKEMQQTIDSYEDIEAWDSCTTIEMNYDEMEG